MGLWGCYVTTQNGSEGALVGEEIGWTDRVRVRRLPAAEMASRTSPSRAPLGRLRLRLGEETQRWLDINGLENYYL